MTDRLTRDFELVAASDAALDTTLTNARATIQVLKGADVRRDLARVQDVARIVRRFQTIATTVMPLSLEYPAGGDDAARAAWAARVHEAMSK